MQERLMLKRNLSVIAILAAVAPLFGLLGTVTGMMTTFDVIGIFGTGNAKAMAGGISEALITTQSGLLVAIPGLFMSEMLNRKNNRMEGSLNELVLTLKRYV
jgi:biopolymer transport protein ExbB